MTDSYNVGLVFFGLFVAWAMGTALIVGYTGEEKFWRSFAMWIGVALAIFVNIAPLLPSKLTGIDDERQCTVFLPKGENVHQVQVFVCVGVDADEAPISQVELYY